MDIREGDQYKKILPYGQYNIIHIYIQIYAGRFGFRNFWTAKLGCQGALGRQVGLPRCTWTPSRAVQGHLGGKLGCQGSLGRHFGLQLGAQVPPQSAPNLEFCSTVRHFLDFFKNCFLCCPSALGLLFGSSWGLPGCLLGSTWSLLGASWAPLGAS